MNKQSVVLIPTIAAQSNNHCFLEVYTLDAVTPLTEEEKEALKKGLCLVVLPLLTVSLYRKGLVVKQLLHSFIFHQKQKKIEAITERTYFKKLNLPVGFIQFILDKLFNLLIYTKINWLKKYRLYCGGVEGSIDGDSCQLGLALGLLLPSYPIKNPTKNGIIATGALQGLEGKIEIKPVAEIPKKLQLVLNKRLAHQLTKEHYLFFTPVFYFNEEKKPCKVIERPEIKQLAAVGIKVRPINELNEVVTELNLLPMKLAYKRYYFGVLFLAIIGIMGNSLYQQINLEIPLKFQAGKKGYKKKPFIVCSKNGGHVVKYHPFKKDGSYNLVFMPTTTNDKWNTHISWRIKMPEETGLNAYFPKSWKGYYATYINIAEKTGLTLYQHEKKLMPGDNFEKTWQLQEPAQEERCMLAILVSYYPVDLTKLETKLRTIKKDNYSTVRNFLKKNFKGSLFFHYSIKLKSLSTCRVQ